MSEYIFIKGKASWVRPDKLNEWNKWSMVLHPDADGLALVRDLQTEGLKNVISKDDDGYFIRLSRAAELKVQGKIKGMSPPEVFDGTKPLPGGGYLPIRDKLIGNGSDCIAKCEVYSYNVPGMKGKRAKAMRWESVRIDNLIPYEKKDFDPATVQAAAGFEQQSKQMF